MNFIMSIAGKDVLIEMLEPSAELGFSGKFFPLLNKIQINPVYLSEEGLKQTLLHEVIHAIFHNSGLTQHLDNVGRDVEELICANLDSLLSPVIEFRNDAFVAAPEPKRKRKVKK